MSKFWVRIDNVGTFCTAGAPSTCFSQRLANPSTQNSERALSQLQEATDKINAMMGDEALNAAGAGHEVAFLVIRDPDGNDRLQLSYIDTSTTVTTFFG